MSFLAVAAHAGADELDLEPMLAVAGRSGWDGSHSHRAPGLACAALARWTVPEDEHRSLIAVDPYSGRVVVWDGRLDDRPALLRVLGLDAGLSNAELVLAAYARWGDAAPQHLLGEFAFVLIDERAGRVFAARDPLGIRPLVYTRVAGGLRFASEERALLALPGVADDPDQASAVRFVVETFAAREATLYEQIKPVAAGSWLSIEAGRMRSGAYYRPDPWRVDEQRSDSDWAHALRSVVATAVAARARGRARVAIMASGGLDSSAIATLEAEQQWPRERALLLHLRCAGFGCDELRLVKQVAQRIGSEVIVAEGSGRVFSPATAQEIDLPDTWAGPYGELFESAAAAGCRVVLTGEGSDEVQGWHGSEVEDAIGRRALADAARFAGLYDEPGALSPWRRLFTAAMRAWVLPQSFLDRRAFARRELPAWLSPRGKQLAHDGIDEQLMHDREVGHPSRLRRAICSSLLWSTSLTWSYANVRRFASHRGVDLVLPFLDVRVVDLLLQMPARLRTSFDMIKPIQRRAFEGRIPVGLLWNQRSADYTEFHRQAWTAASEGWVALSKGSCLAALGLVEANAFEQAATKVMAAWAATPPGTPLNLRSPTINALQVEAWLRSRTKRH